MVAGVGRRQLAQVLRNSLFGHPPTTGTTRCHESEPLARPCLSSHYHTSILPRKSSGSMTGMSASPKSFRFLVTIKSH